MFTGLWLAAAFAWTPEVLQSRLDSAEEYASLRTSRIHPGIERSSLVTLSKGGVATGLSTVPGRNARIAWGVAVLNAPVAKLYSAVNDELNKPAYSKLSHVHLLEGEYCGARRLAFQYLPVPIVTDRWWVVEQLQNTVLQAQSNGRVRELTWLKQADGNPLLDADARKIAAGGMQVDDNDGGWWMLGLDDHTTLVQFWALSDPGGHLPVGLVSQFAGGSIRETFANIETLARKGPACDL